MVLLSAQKNAPCTVHILSALKALDFRKAVNRDSDMYVSNLNFAVLLRQTVPFFYVVERAALPVRARRRLLLD